MTKRQVERFFTILAAQLAIPANVYLTGAAAAALWGRVRPSADVDFGIELPARSTKGWDEVFACVARASRLTGISASVAEDIDRWGMITLLDYRRSSRLYRRFGGLKLRLLHPVNWAIGKLTRHLDPDVRDVVEVFRKQAVAPRRAATTWGTALRASPASNSQFQFRTHVENFFRQRGRAIWGAGFDPDAAIATFHRAAKIRPNA